MKKYKLLPFLLSAVFIFCLLPVHALAASGPELTSASAVLMDANTGEVLFEKDSSRTVDTSAANALMTALLVSEAVQNQEVDLDEDVTAPEDVRSGLDFEGAATLEPAIVPGETLTVDELLHAILLRSAGDACNALAVKMAGSISVFVQSMNARAQELGCTSTNFVDTSGQLAGQRTTAQDVACIARAAAAVPTLLSACESAAFTVSTTNMAGERALSNSNLLMVPDSEFYYGEAYGLKAGYSATDGYCAIAAASSGDIDAIAVVMGNADGSERFKDAIALLDWVFDNYSYRPILSETEAIDNVAVTLGTTDSVAVRPDDSIRLLLPNDQDLGDVQYVTTYYHEQENRELIAPVEAGTVLGEVAVYRNGEMLGTAHLLATGTSDMSRLEYLRTQAEQLIQSEAVRKLLKALVIMFAVYLLLVLFYWFQRVRHMVSLRRAKRARAKSLARQEVAWLDIPEETEQDAPIDYFPPEEYEGEPAPAPQPAKAKRPKKIKKLSRRQKAEEQPAYDGGYDDGYDGGYDDGYDGGGYQSAPQDQAAGQAAPPADGGDGYDDNEYVDDGQYVDDDT